MNWFTKILDRMRGKAIQLPEAVNADYQSPSKSLSTNPHDYLRKKWFITKRDIQMANLQASYSELFGLVRSIRDHLNNQGHIQKKVVEVLNKVPGTIDGLKNIGQAAHKQAEVLELINENLKDRSKQDEKFIGSMDRFNQTLQEIDGSNKRYADTVTLLAARARDSEFALRRMLKQSERRFALLLILMISFITLSIGVGAYLFWPILREFQDKISKVMVLPAPVVYEAEVSD